jgi:hypothetical protein
VTGKYVAYGKKPNQVYNQFLKDAFECNEQIFSIFEIKKEADEIAQAKKKQRAEERKKIAEQLKAAKESAHLV